MILLNLKAKSKNSQLHLKTEKVNAYMLRKQLRSTCGRKDFNLFEKTLREFVLAQYHIEGPKTNAHWQIPTFSDMIGHFCLHHDLANGRVLRPRCVGCVLGMVLLEHDHAVSMYIAPQQKCASRPFTHSG